MNKVVLTGRLTHDIELRYTNSNKTLVYFSLAVQETKDITYFISCVAWNKTAELMKEYLHKGDKIGITGHIATRKYQDKNSFTKQVTEVIVENLEFLNQSKKDNNVEKVNIPEQKEDTTNIFKDFGENIEINEELPFE